MTGPPSQVRISCSPVTPRNISSRDRLSTATLIPRIIRPVHGIGSSSCGPIWFRRFGPMCSARKRSGRCRRVVRFGSAPKTVPRFVVPAGEYIMGSPPGEEGRSTNEGPQHRVAIARPFAVSKFDVTFADWDACVSVGGCRLRGFNPSKSRPAIGCGLAQFETE